MLAQQYGSELRMESRSVSRFAGRRIHFIGIAGSGMIGLARILRDAGAIVTGSDPNAPQHADEFDRLGIRTTREQRGQLLSRALDLVVRTAAVPDSNEEFQKAAELGIEHIKYAQLLGQVMSEKFGIAVSGTHGKSTTTSMLAFALSECGVDPSFVIGASSSQLGGSSRSGTGEAFVVEACEYDRSFHNLWPKVALITNIEADHLDCYPGGLPQIIESFHAFATHVPADGLIIAQAHSPSVAAAVAGLSPRVEYVEMLQRRAKPAHREAPTWSVQVIAVKHGCYWGEVRRDGKWAATLRLCIPGDHNLMNATMAVAACAAAGADPQQAADAISRFTGVDRRMTEVGHYQGATVVDDYGHHPTEIKKTLKALKARYNPARLLCVFQPHQGSRTRLLMEEFATSFEDADLTIIPEIYYVRDSEEERRATRAMDLVNRVVRNGQSAIHLPKLEQITKYLRQELRRGDLVVTMGAGNVWTVGKELVADVAKVA